MRVLTPLIALSVGAACAKHVKPVRPAPAPTRSISELVCGEAPTLIAVAASEGHGAFVLHDDGRLDVPSVYDRSDPLFSFPDAKSDDIVRIDDADGQDPSSSHVMACGHVNKVAFYALPSSGKFAPTASSIVSIRLFRTYDNRKQENGKVIAQLATTLEKAERDQVRREEPVRAAVDALDELAVAPGLLDGVSARVAFAIGYLAVCDGPAAEATVFGPARCDERRTLRARLRAIEAVLWSAVSAKPEDIAKQLVAAHLDQLVEAVRAPAPLVGAERKAHCGGIAQLRWATADSVLRLQARAAIPLVDGDDLERVEYGANLDVAAASATHSLGILVTNAPSGVPGSFAKRQGTQVTADVSTLIITALPAFLKGLPAVRFQGLDVDALLGSYKLTIEKGKDESAFDDQLSQVCIPKEGEKLPVQAIPGDIPPIAKVEARAYIVGPIGQKYTAEVAACEGTTCTAAQDDKYARSRVSITPTQRGRFTLLAELSGGVGLVGSERGRADFGWDGQSAPRFEPILGAGGPDQVFELRRGTEPRNAFATSLLFGAHIRDHWFLGAGPSLLVGSSGSLLTQWSLHAGFHPFSVPGVYVTLGPSLRLVQQPDALKDGSLAVVQIPASGMASAPQFSTHEAVVLQFDIGFAIDIGAAGSAAGSIVSAFGGKQ